MGITVLLWYVCSSDFNPVDNRWGCMAQQVHRNYREFQNSASQKATMERVCAKMRHNRLDPLNFAMRRSCVKVWQMNGCESHHEFA